MGRYTEKRNIVHIFECDPTLGSELLSSIENIITSERKQYVIEPGTSYISISVYNKSMKLIQRITVNIGEYLRVDSKGILSIINESMLNNLIKVE